MHSTGKESWDERPRRHLKVKYDNMIAFIIAQRYNGMRIYVTSKVLHVFFGVRGGSVVFLVKFHSSNMFKSK